MKFASVNNRYLYCLNTSECKFKFSVCASVDGLWECDLNAPPLAEKFRLGEMRDSVFFYNSFTGNTYLFNKDLDKWFHYHKWI